MTTYIAFSPNNNSSPPFQSIFTLDNVDYTGTVTWNVTGARWYFTLSDQSGNVIWNGALIGSPTDSDIYLAPNVFTTSTILYREDTGNFEVNP